MKLLTFPGFSSDPLKVSRTDSFPVPARVTPSPKRTTSSHEALTPSSSLQIQEKAFTQVKHLQPAASDVQRVLANYFLERRLFW